MFVFSKQEETSLKGHLGLEGDRHPTPPTTRLLASRQTSGCAPPKDSDKSNPHEPLPKGKTRR